MKKKYYLLCAGQREEEWYGPESVCCIDRRELERLCADFSKESGESKASLLRCWREATDAEITEYGVYDSSVIREKKTKDANYYIIGGQYRFCCYGSAETIRGAKLIAAKHDEYWDNWQGWHRPRIYAARDCREIETETGKMIVPDRDKTDPVIPVAVYDWEKKRWTNRGEE